MTDLKIKYIFTLVLGGGDWHKLAICVAAIIATNKGYKVEDMKNWIHSDYQPDLVLKKQDRVINGPRRDNKVFTYWVEVIHSHDPAPDWKEKGKKAFDDVIFIRIPENVEELTIKQLWDLIDKAIL